MTTKTHTYRCNECGESFRNWDDFLNHPEPVRPCQVGPVGGHSNRRWCSVHKDYADEPWNGTTCKS